MPRFVPAVVCGFAIRGHLFCCALACLVLLGGWGCGPTIEGTSWTMINVCGKDGQADCHLLSLADGSFVLIDAADAVDAPGTAVAFLKKNRVKTLRLVVISHFHMDHYGRLLDIIEAGIRVERVAINLPGDRRLADRERPWGCDYDHVLSVLGTLSEKQIPYFTPKIGERLLEISKNGVTTSLDAVCLYDGIHTPIGETDLNDTSIIVRFTHGKTRALFTGDLNLGLGTYLATSDFDLSADILKAPHHGTEGVAPNEFFDRVGAKAVLVTSPHELWLSLRSKRVRDYFGERNVPAYVSGIHGDVTVRFTGDGFEIESERGGASATPNRRIRSL